MSPTPQRTGPRRVFLHVGLPKTGTTYLQDALWANKQVLRERGLLLPGARRRHLLASLEVREDPGLARRPGDTAHPWQDLVAEAQQWPGDVLVTHEFFAAASVEQVRRVVADLTGAEVHVLVTARAMPDLFISRWQEWVKNGARGPIDAYPPDGPRADTGEWGWPSFDLGIVLERWGAVLPHERVHVLPMAPGSSEPGDLDGRRHPDEVDEAEMLACATEAMARLTGDVRSLTRERDALSQAPSRPPRPSWLRVNVRGRGPRTG